MTAERTAYSRVSVKSQTVLPRDVRERLGVGPGDRLRYRISENAVIIEKATAALPDDPFASFVEWASVEDDTAFADL